MAIRNIILICVEEDSRKICWMIYEFYSSAKLNVNIPQLKWQFMHNVLDNAGSSFPVAWFSTWR